jgi:hypothetical protein
MISEGRRWTYHRGMGKPSELYSEVSWDGNLVYHPEIFFRPSQAVRGHIDVEAWRSFHWENGFLAKTKMMNSLDSNPRAKSRSWGEVKWKDTYGSLATCVPFLVWLEQEWLLDRKDAVLIGTRVLSLLRPRRWALANWAAGGRAPVSAPPRPGPPPSVRAAVGPRWTERARPVHGGMDPVHGFIRWKINPSRNSPPFCKEAPVFLWNQPTVEFLDFALKPSAFPKLTCSP